MRNLMRKVDSLAAAQSACRVKTVHVWLGALSHMSADHFREHFALASANTLAEGACLHIEESSDIGDPNALELVLMSIEVET